MERLACSYTYKEFRNHLFLDGDKYSGRERVQQLACNSFLSRNQGNVFGKARRQMTGPHLLINMLINDLVSRLMVCVRRRSHVSGLLLRKGVFGLGLLW